MCLSRVKWVFLSMGCSAAHGNRMGFAGSAEVCTRVCVCELCATHLCMDYQCFLCHACSMYAKKKMKIKTKKKLGNTLIHIIVYNNNI